MVVQDISLGFVLLSEPPFRPSRNRNSSSTQSPIPLISQVSNPKSDPRTISLNKIPPTPPLHSMANRKLIRFEDNAISLQLEEEENTSVFLITDTAIPQHDLLNVLRICFPSDGHVWKLTQVGEKNYRVEAPQAWRSSAIAQGFVQLGAFRVRVVQGSAVSDGGVDPVRGWLRISNFPRNLIYPGAVSFLIYDFVGGDR